MAAVTPDFFRIRVNPPSQFGGGDSEKFDDWIEHFRSYIAIVDHELITSLDTVEKDLDRVILFSDYIIRGNSPEQNEAFRQKRQRLLGVAGHCIRFVCIARPTYYRST